MKKEIVKGGVDSEDIRIPIGKFTVDAFCVKADVQDFDFEDDGEFVDIEYTTENSTKPSGYESEDDMRWTDSDDDEEIYDNERQAYLNSKINYAEESDMEFIDEEPPTYRHNSINASIALSDSDVDGMVFENKASVQWSEMINEEPEIAPAAVVEPPATPKKVVVPELPPTPVTRHISKTVGDDISIPNTDELTRKKSLVTEVPFDNLLSSKQVLDQL